MKELLQMFDGLTTEQLKTLLFLETGLLTFPFTYLVGKVGAYIVYLFYKLINYLRNKKSV